MSWKRNYLPGAFRGVSFHVETADETGGRNVVTDRFPESEAIHSTDLGPLPASFSFAAYVLGDDYFSKRNALRTALAQPGSGVLTHPYRGTMRVHITEFKISEQTQRGRMARFDIACTLATITATRVRPDTKALVGTAADALEVANIAWMQSKEPLWKRLVSAVHDLNTVLNAGVRKLQDVKKITNTQAEFKRALSNMQGKIIAAAFTAKSIVQDFYALAEWDIFSQDSRAAFRETLQLAAFHRDRINTQIAKEDQPADGGAAMSQRTLAYAGTAASARALMGVDFDSEEEALAYEAQWLAIVNELLEEAAIDDTVFLALRNLKAAVRNDQEERVLLFGSVLHYRPTKRTNALELCNTLYGELALYGDLVARNALAHPGIINAFDTVKVRVP